MLRSWQVIDKIQSGGVVLGKGKTVGFEVMVAKGIAFGGGTLGDVQEGVS